MSVESARKKLEEQRQQLGLVTPTKELGEFSIESAKDSLSTAREKLKIARDNLETVEPVEKEATGFERIVQQPYQRAVGRQAATFERIAEGTTTPGSVLLQTISNPVSMLIDSAANAVVVGAEEAFGMLLPDDMEEAAKQKFKEMLNTEYGQKAIAALSEGEEAWKAFSKMYPDEAANMAGFADIYFGVPRNIIKDFSPDLKPLKIEKVGLRNEVQPLEGIDKDIYNIAYSKPGGKKTLEQAEMTTGPRGLMGAQKQIANEDQLNVLDELRKAGVKGNLTVQDNFNNMISYLDKLDDAVIKISRRVKEPVDMGLLRQNLRSEISTMISGNPAVFGEASKATNRKIKDLVSQFMVHVEEQGNSVEGIIQARRAFDSDMERLGMDLGTSKTSTNILLARAVRNAANKSIFNSVPEAEQIFSKMSRVLSVYDNVGIKASQEAATNLGRLAVELGLKDLMGGTGKSQLINVPLALGYSVLASPVIMLKRAMKAEIPAKGRAKVAYALRDVKNEISKALSKVKDPKKKASLLKSKEAAWVALEAAAAKLEKEYEE